MLTDKSCEPLGNTHKLTVTVQSLVQDCECCLLLLAKQIVSLSRIPIPCTHRRVILHDQNHRLRDERIFYIVTFLGQFDVINLSMLRNEVHLFNQSPVQCFRGPSL